MRSLEFELMNGELGGAGRQSSETETAAL